MFTYLFTSILRVSSDAFGIKHGTVELLLELQFIPSTSIMSQGAVKHVFMSFRLELGHLNLSILIHLLFLLRSPFHIWRCFL